LDQIRDYSFLCFLKQVDTCFAAWSGGQQGTGIPILFESREKSVNHGAADLELTGGKINLFDGTTFVLRKARDYPSSPGGRTPHCI